MDPLPTTPNGTPLILIVDDEAPIRRVFARTLQRANYRVIEAADGKQALQLIERFEPKVLLLDMRMPHLDGFGVLAALGDRLTQLPVVVISGNGDIQNAILALREGAFDYLTKPLENLELLLFTVRRALEWRDYRLQEQQQRARLEAEVKARTSELRELAAHLEAVREEEKRHLAKEVHDELGARFTALSMDLGWLTRHLDAAPAEITDRLAEMRQQVKEASAISRRIISDLRPSVLDTLGLEAALEWLANEFASHSGLDVRFHSHAVTQEPCDAIKLCLFRITQESLTNIARHAHAQHLRLNLLKLEDELLLEVQDDGQGFDPYQRPANAHGLRGMQERVLLLGGELSFETAPNEGCCVRVQIPFRPPEKNT